DERGNFNLDLCPEIDQAIDVKQRRGRKISSERLAPRRTDAGARGFVFAPAGQIPGEPNDVLGTGAGLGKQLDDPTQGNPHLCGHVRLVIPLLIAPGLAGEHDPSAGTIDRDTVREAARLGPFGRLQDTHEGSLQSQCRPPILSRFRTKCVPVRIQKMHWTGDREPGPRSTSANLRVANPQGVADTGCSKPSRRACRGMHGNSRMDRTPSKPRAASWMAGWLSLMLIVAVAGRE